MIWLVCLQKKNCWYFSKDLSENKLEGTNLKQLIIFARVFIFLYFVKNENNFEPFDV